MISTDQVVAEARSHKGVKFHHQGSSEAGLDCAGFLMLVARRLRIVPPDFLITNYSRSPDGSMRELCDKYMQRSTAPEFGGVVLMRINGRNREQHVGFVGRDEGGLTLIHADDMRAKCVTEVRLQFGRYLGLAQAYRLPGVAY